MNRSRGNIRGGSFYFPSMSGSDWRKSENGRNNLDHLWRDPEKMPKLGEGDYLPNLAKAQEHSMFGDGDGVPIGRSGGTQSQAQQKETFFGKSRGIGKDFEGAAENAAGETCRPITSNDQPKPNLIVNYLPQYLTDNDFFNLFGPFGPLESIKIMRDPQTGYSFGYGFVNYAELLDAVKARNGLNGLQIGHKKIKVSFARPPSEDIKDTNLFVTGLPHYVTENDLDAMFSPFGVIVHLRVLRDRFTKATRGVAFVRYETRSQACAAILEMNGIIPKGNKDPIRVRLAQDHGKQKAAYLAGFQAALTVKKALGGWGPETSRLRQEEAFSQVGQRNDIPGRVRPSTMSGVSNQCGMSGNMYWKGFGEATAGTLNQRLSRTMGNLDHYPYYAHYPR